MILPVVTFGHDILRQKAKPVAEITDEVRQLVGDLLESMYAAKGVGLAAPHLVRSIVRVTHERHIVLSSLMGAVLLLAADILARWLLAPQELPVGVLTAALGGTYLLWLMHRRTSQGGAL